MKEHPLIVPIFHLPSRKYSVKIRENNIRTNNIVDDDDIKESEVVSYTLRGLKQTDYVDIEDSTVICTELDGWATFCEKVFSYKQPNPPKKDYFLRHYINDPYRDISHIRIATTTTMQGESKEVIVASCRVFHRYISFPSNFNLLPNNATSTNVTKMRTTTIVGGGIGEVCTLDIHRYRGLSKELLCDAITCMKQQQQVQDDNDISKYMISFLHAAPSFFPVYQKAGYHNVTSYWSVITIDQTKLLLSSKAQPITEVSTTKMNYESTNSKYTIRLVQFPNDTNQLVRLHQMYTEQRYIGCIVRSIDYWNQYIAGEIQNTLYVLEEEQEQDEDSDSHHKKIIGWMSLRYREQQQRYQLREFGCCTSKINTSSEIQYIFMQLLVYCYQITVDEDIIKMKDNDVKTVTKPNIHGVDSFYWKLHLPTSILNEVTNNNVKEYILDTVSENDLGWMYKPLFETVATKTSTMIEKYSNNNCNNANNNAEVMDDNSCRWLEEIAKYDHLIWPSDSF